METRKILRKFPMGRFTKVSNSTIFKSETTQGSNLTKLSRIDTERTLEKFTSISWSKSKSQKNLTNTGLTHITIPSPSPQGFMRRYKISPKKKKRRRKIIGGINARIMTF